MSYYQPRPGQLERMQIDMKYIRLNWNTESPRLFDKDYPAAMIWNLNLGMNGKTDALLETSLVNMVKSLI